MSIYSDQEFLSVDLIVDAVYVGAATSKGGVSDPLVKLVGVSRQGGFRYRGNKNQPRLLVLTSNLSEVDWPDELDETTGRFTYYGDNRNPGRQLHDTPRFGNLILRDIFEKVHAGERANIPPILIFTKEVGGRSFRFRGLAVPGHEALSSNEDLVAVWKSSGKQRFQNYRAVFTILDEAVVSRAWIQEFVLGTACKPPVSWELWVATGVAKALIAPRTQLVRSKKEQLPESDGDKKLMNIIRERFSKNYVAFEVCAAALCKMLLPNVLSLELTRPWRDGGRDGVGVLELGKGAAAINVVFALEAKCYSEKKSVGVRDVSRLISRIRHREFGVFVTTSFIGAQAYKEIVDDGHPLILVSAIDILSLLKSSGYSTPQLLNEWLSGLE
ncbi:restriction endonuclease [Pseudomonas viridiflava]|uniref:restriction endonuclease n=1 Tax=Pseudomonas viridiflava TaxID=33069 RepID=UPI001C31D2C8|nr:restriction endonuclease [Pseudomonas viridiflava]QXG29259.1 restriction endonuclease [Pseudomonas viridiflava]